MKKVTAKNLMIGDWVLQRGKYRQVQSLPIICNEYKIILDCYACSTATPIPITEEVITQVKHSLRNVPISVDYLEYEQHLWISDFVHSTNHYWGIQYIHQLQQAYRLATGKELKVKF
jgi:hypothetical protein